MAHVQQFSRLLDKFEGFFCEAVCDIFDQFFCLIFQNGIQASARFTEYQIYNCWNWFVLWWRTFGSENMQIPDKFWQDHFKIAIFGQHLIGDGDVWKHFKYWLCSSNVVWKHWTYFPKDMLIKSKARYLLHFFYELVSAFDKFQWMLRNLLLKIIFFALIFKGSIF